MTEQQSGGESSNPERDEALRRVRHLPMAEPLSDEEFKQRLVESRRREEAEKHLPEYDPVAAERLAYEMNPLTRGDERFRVQDPLEAEHTAHAMDPHYVRASEIDRVKERTDEELDRALHPDDVDEVFPEGETPEKGVRSAGELFEARIDGLAAESQGLEDAASSAREAGDAHGEQVSKAYRRKKKSSGA
jgi:hypothetical protein